jgi:hypothetical protein
VTWKGAVRSPNGRQRYSTAVASARTAFGPRSLMRTKVTLSAPAAIRPSLASAARPPTGGSSACARTRTPSPPPSSAIQCLARGLINVQPASGAIGSMKCDSTRMEDVGDAVDQHKQPDARPQIRQQPVNGGCGHRAAGRPPLPARARRPRAHNLRCARHGSGSRQRTQSSRTTAS